MAQIVNRSAPLAGLMLLVAAFLAGCGRTLPGGDESLQRVRQGGKLRVAVDPTYPPMEFLGAGGTPKGFDLDIAAEVAKRLGVEAEFLIMDWSGIIAGLQSRRYDIIISSMNITAQRQQQVAFVEYVQMSQVFVCRPGTVVSREEDLAEKTVAVQTNTTSHNYVEAVRKNGIDIGAIKPFPTATDTFNALKAGQVDAVVTDEPVGKYYAKKDTAFTVTGQAMKPEPVGIALHKGDKALHQAVAQAVEEMKRDGTYKRISEEWFGGQLGQPVRDELDFWSFSTQVVLPQLFHGMWLTVQLTLWSGLFGIVLGLLLALLRIARNRPVSSFALFYVTLFRGTPLLLQILFVFFAVPLLLNVRLDAFPAAILALSLNAAAYVSEIMRAAIQSIDKGQMEAARALGMSYGLTMRRIILPQTYRRMLPPLVNELAALSKDTSLVMVIALPELLYQTQRLAATYLRPWEVYGWAALGYLSIVLMLTALATFLERRLATREG